MEQLNEQNHNSERNREIVIHNVIFCAFDRRHEKLFTQLVCFGLVSFYLFFYSFARSLTLSL